MPVDDDEDFSDRRHLSDGSGGGGGCGGGGNIVGGRTSSGNHHNTSSGNNHMSSHSNNNRSGTHFSGGGANHNSHSHSHSHSGGGHGFHLQINGRSPLDALAMLHLERCAHRETRKELNQLRKKYELLRDEFDSGEGLSQSTSLLFSRMNGDVSLNFSLH